MHFFIVSGNHVYVCVCVFFFFFHAFVRLATTVYALECSWKLVCTFLLRLETTFVSAFAFFFFFFFFHAFVRLVATVYARCMNSRRKV